ALVPRQLGEDALVRGGGRAVAAAADDAAEDVDEVHRREGPADGCGADLDGDLHAEDLRDALLIDVEVDEDGVRPHDRALRRTGPAAAVHGQLRHRRGNGEAVVAVRIPADRKST